MGSEDDFYNMMNDIRKLIHEHIDDDRVSVVLNLIKDDNTLSISINGIADMEIRFENSMYPKSN